MWVLSGVYMFSCTVEYFDTAEKNGTRVNMCIISVFSF